MEMNKEPIVIWGAGAIGGTIGAYLIRSGVDVLFVDISLDHVKAINQVGLSVEGPIEEFTVTARAVTPDALKGTFSSIWLCTKAQHTDLAARAIVPHLAEHGHVLSLQNGLNEFQIMKAVGKSATIGAFINFGSDYLSPGRILFGGRGAVVVGELDGAKTRRLTEIKHRLSIFEPNAKSTTKIWGYLWGKLGYAAILFATALTNDSIADVLARREYRSVLTELACEMTALAECQGVVPLGFNG
ncbi:MAG: 2-dehydropantoate 2-reductase N-terminal domain-containing protein, partial [Paracoccaceae bacterium]|nr:2-dehydropantoate 2-reductase N-terminal domain-containing protein [Paracoccaceae bacterium]